MAVVAIALPTIVDDIGGETGYSWVGSAYMLSSSFTFFIQYFTDLDDTGSGCL